MVKCLWCLKELGIFGMLFHKAVCLEYLYSKSLDKLKQAQQKRLITREQYLNEKKNLKEYFMQRFKPKVYEAFIKRQKEQQYIVINPNELSVALESDMDIISKKVCIESQEISQKSQFLQSFENRIEPDYNYLINNYSDNQDIQPVFNSDDNHINSIEFNQNDDMSMYQLEIHNIGNTNLQIDQYENSQDQFVQLQFQQNHILQQNEEIQEDQIVNPSPESHEEEKENVLFKLLQNKVQPNIRIEFKRNISKNKNKKLTNLNTNTRSKSRKIKQNSQVSETTGEIFKNIQSQEELATEIKLVDNNCLQTNKKNPPKFSQSTDKINQKINQPIEISSTKGLNKRQKKNKNLITNNTNNAIKTEGQQKNSQQNQKSQQREIIKTRYQASLGNQQNKTKSKSINRREQQKIKKK